VATEGGSGADRLKAELRTLNFNPDKATGCFSILWLSAWGLIPWRGAAAYQLSPEHPGISAPGDEISSASGCFGKCQKCLVCPGTF